MHTGGTQCTGLTVYLYYLIKFIFIVHILSLQLDNCDIDFNHFSQPYVTTEMEDARTMCCTTCTINH